jgi:hypothetical protein
MKKIFFVLCCFVSTRSYSQIKIGVEGGYHSASFAQSGETSAPGYGMSPFSISGFNAGIVSEIPLSKKIFLQPGLLYFSNGTHIIGQGGISGYTGSSYTAIQLYYLRLPVNVVYKMKLNNRFNLLVGAGLYTAKGLSGTGKGNEEETSPFARPSAYSFNSKVDFSDDDSPSSANNTKIKPFDFGFTVLAGIEWGNFQLTANYSHGFSQVYADGGYQYKNVAFGITLAYLFAVKK